MAKAHGTRTQQAAAFGKLAAAAGGAHNVAAYCAAAAHPGASSSRQPRPAPAPRGSGKPSGRPAPHGSGNPSGSYTPRRAGMASGLPMLGGTGGPIVHPRVKPGSRDAPGGVLDGGQDAGLGAIEQVGREQIACQDRVSLGAQES